MTTPLSHTPAYHVYVDFTTDTSFVYPNATEITTDVQTLDIVGRGKNLLKQQAEAACLTAVLNNSLQKYTPTYTGSAIYPNLLPGKHVWALMGYPADQFSGMVATNPLTARKPDHDSTFAVWSGDTANWQYATPPNGVVPVTGINALPVVLNFGESCCHVGALIQAPSSWAAFDTPPGVVFRYVDSSNYWIARVVNVGGDISIDVAKIVAGVPSHWSESVSWDAGATHWLIVELAANDKIRVYVDNQLIVGNPITPIVDSTFNTSTLHGLGVLSAQAVGGAVFEFGGYRPVFTGRVDTWSPNLDQTLNECTMVAYDDMERQYIFPVMKTAPPAPTYAGDIVNEILDALGYSPYHRAVDDGSLLLTIDGAGQERLLTRDALTEIHQIEGDDVGFYWIDGNGLAHYESYAFRASMPIVKTWYASRQNNLESDICFNYQQSIYDDGKDRVLNDIIFNYYFMTVVTGTPVWTLNNAYDIPFVASGQTITLCALGSGDQIANPIPPVGTTDFTVNTQADGGGTDITGDCVASVVLGYSGNVAIITLKNNNALGGYVTFFQLRADQQTNSYVTGARGYDATSDNAYGLRRFTWDTLHIADFTTAQLQVLKLLSIRKPRLAHWTFKMTNATQANLMQIIHRTISERVHVIHTPITMDSDFNIENWSIHIPQQGGSYIECSWEIQASLPLLYSFLHRKKFTPAELVSIRGTITATHNSTAIVGAGSPPPLFVYWNVGDRIQLPDSNWYTIAAIADSTHLTLSTPYLGTTASGASYAMERINYPIELTVHRSAGADSGNDVYVGTDCKEDYSDLRFALTDMSTTLSYWVEHTSVTSASAKVWINVPSIISDSSVPYYMLYGNEFAVDESDGAATFEFFDDFLGIAIDYTKWHLNDGAQTYVSASVLNLGYTARLGALAACKYGTGKAFRFYGYTNKDYQDYTNGWWWAADSKSELNVAATDEAAMGQASYQLFVKTMLNSVATTQTRSWSMGTGWQSLEIQRVPGSCDFYQNGVFKDSVTTNIPTADCGFVFDLFGWGVSEAFLHIDWCCVRKVACTEPTCGTWITEE